MVNRGAHARPVRGRPVMLDSDVFANLYQAYIDALFNY